MTAQKRKGGHGNPFVPTDAQRSQVEAMAAYGIPQADIARVLEISVPTLVAHFREEVDTGATKANAKVAQSLFKKATGDGPQAVTAAIFWAKTRMGWTERTVVDSTISLKSADEMTDDELAAIAAGSRLAHHATTRNQGEPH